MRDRIVGLKSIPLRKFRGFAGGNPKTPTEAELQQLDDSLEAHGYVVPVIVRECDDGMYELIDGHTRIALISSRDPDAKVKAIVLDVDSVKEGRRILLALQHHVGFDTGKLETFVQDAMREGTSAADLIADIGLGANELEAFADAAREALEGAGGGEGDGDEDEPPSRAGLNPEHVQFSATVSRPQSATISKAIALAKKITGRDVKGDALEVLAVEYLAAHQEKAPKTKSKKKGARRGA